MVPSAGKDNARLFFYRDSRFMSRGADAAIHINNNKVGECGNNAYFFIDVKAGRHITITADNKGTPGTHTIEKDIASGNEYYIEVLVNEAYVESGIILGLIGQATYVAANKNSSGWIFKETPKEQAAQKIQNNMAFSMNSE
jgi:hypothetical protein